MKFRVCNDFKEIDDGLILKTIDSAYADWYWGHDGEITDPDKTLRLVLKGDLLNAYEKSYDLRKMMQYVMDYTCNNCRDIIDYIQGRKGIEDMCNTDGTPLKDFDLGLLLHFNSWSNGKLLRDYYAREQNSYK